MSNRVLKLPTAKTQKQLKEQRQLVEECRVGIGRFFDESLEEQDSHYRTLYLKLVKDTEFVFNKMEETSRRLGTLNIRYNMEKDKVARLEREVAELKARLDN